MKSQKRPWNRHIGLQEQELLAAQRQNLTCKSDFPSYTQVRASYSKKLKIFNAVNKVMPPPDGGPAVKTKLPR